MKNELRQQQLFPDERPPAWGSLTEELKEAIDQLLSLLLEQELTSLTKQAGPKKEPKHV